MRYTQSFLKTSKQAPKDAETISHQFLTRGGFIHTLGAGFYSMLPMGFRVREKVMQIIKEELNAIGVEDMIMPVVHPAKLWKETGRFETIGPELWRIKNRSKEDFVLAMTHEEIVTDAAKPIINSYKDLPKLVGQIQIKVRDEARARGGLLRTREFTMQDAYSFDRDEAGLNKNYDKFIGAYKKIFKRVGVETVMIKSDTGAMGGLDADEFMMVADNGEDRIFTCPVCGYAANAEYLEAVSLHQEPDDIPLTKDEKSQAVSKSSDCPRCLLMDTKHTKMGITRGIEVGNTFKLGTKYSGPLKLNYKDEKNQEHSVVMGSYGIGVERLIASVVEASHDDSGIIWPGNIAPYRVYLISIGEDKAADKLYQRLIKAGVEVFYDDRDVSPGEKFADADLFGMPYRAVVGAKAKGKVELKKRDAKKVELLSVTEFLRKVK